MEKGPIAEAMDARQLCDEDEEKDGQFCFIFQSNGAPVEWSWQGKIEVLGEKPVSVPLFPPQIPHGLTWDFFFFACPGCFPFWSIFVLY